MAKVEIEKGLQSSIMWPIAKRCQVTFLGYTGGYYEKDGRYFYTGFGLVIGPQKNTEQAEKALRDHPLVMHLEVKNNFFSALFERMPQLTLFYNPEFILPEPIVITPDGVERWTIGSWDKETLMHFLNQAGKHYPIQLKSIVNKPIQNLHVLSPIPGLSRQQRIALDLALEQGYYAYPRKTTLERLARHMGVSFSTFQAHLRKAEGKIMPFAAQTAIHT